MLRFAALTLASLLQRSIQLSPRAIEVVPCYLGYLVVRGFLASIRSPVIIVDRHFCGDGKNPNWHGKNTTLTMAKGYHINVFTGFMSLSRGNKEVLCKSEVEAYSDLT